MTYDEFIALRAQGKVRAGIDNSTALQLIEHLPRKYQAATHFWSWVGILSVPAFLALGYFVNWFLGIGLLVLLTPVIFSSTKKSAVGFVLEHAQEDRAFFEQLTARDLLIFKHV